MSLLEKHKAAGAIVGGSGEGLPIVQQFSDIASEYEAVRSRAGLLDISHHSRILITGSDRQSFLDGILSARVTAIAEGSGWYATLMEPKGKYIADLRLFHFPQGILIDTSEGMAKQLLDSLTLFRFRAKVAFHDLCSNYIQISLQGPSCDLAAVSAGIPLPESDASFAAVATEDESPLYVARFSDCATSGLYIWVPGQKAESVWDSLESSSAVPIGWQAWNVLRIEAGEPLWGKDIHPGIIPLEACQQRAISYQKCYPGQEVVARIHFRGHVNRMLQILHLDCQSAPQGDITLVADEKRVGEITSIAIRPPDSRVIALGYLRREAVLSRSAIQAVWEDGTCNAEVFPLPYQENA